MVTSDLSGLLGSMVTESKREASAVEVAMPIQCLGLGLLILFAGTFGGRWAILAAGLVLLFVGFVLSGVTVAVQLPSSASGRRSAAADGGR